MPKPAFQQLHVIFPDDPQFTHQLRVLFCHEIQLVSVLVAQPPLYLNVTLR